MELALEMQLLGEAGVDELQQGRKTSPVGFLLYCRDLFLKVALLHYAGIGKHTRGFSGRTP